MFGENIHMAKSERYSTTRRRNHAGDIFCMAGNVLFIDMGNQHQHQHHHTKHKRSMIRDAVLIPSNEETSLTEVTVVDSSPESSEQVAALLHVSSADFFQTSLLIRPTEELAGLYAAHVCQVDKRSPNVRATRLAMACGCFTFRFYGNVVLWRMAAAGFSSGSSKTSQLRIQDIYIPCIVTTDLRESVIKELESVEDNQAYGMSEWLQNAARENYHDRSALQKLSLAMTEDKATSDSASSSNSSLCSTDDDDEEEDVESISDGKTTSFVTKSPLCIHCRRPASTLCGKCHGVYFCDSPRNCVNEGWSHRCQCSTWKAYSRRRKELATIPLGAWCTKLSGREFQVGDQAYRKYLIQNDLTQKTSDQSSSVMSWWWTEVDGWAGGESDSARNIDVTKRVSYCDGFAPLTNIPAEESVSEEAWQKCDGVTCNQVGFKRLKNWADYYELRNITPDSPVALLLTFPLTLYYAIVEYGESPCTVAQMLKRSLRIHVVGTEKELNFLDLFQETVFLLPAELSLELVFIVRQDMLPTSADQAKLMNYSIRFSSRLHVILVSGTYGDTLDPNFDCGSGPPDMIVAFNAGLFAYESWRSVVEYLDHHKSVVGVFTDYNEYSGVHCASLGGAAARNSLRINPFRQPLALPVYSMNLPQMSNGFIYLINELQLE